MDPFDIRLRALHAHVVIMTELPKGQAGRTAAMKLAI
jgi:hypothetical protein